MTVSATLMILAIVGIRKILINHVPSLIFGILWFLVVIRLCIPFDFTTNYNIYNLLYYLRSKLGFESFEISWLWFDRIIMMIWNNPILKICCLVIWLLGVFFIVFRLWKSYRRSNKIHKESFPCPYENDLKNFLARNGLKANYIIKQSGQIQTPIACGILKPAIILPQNFDTENSTVWIQALLHEYMHLKYHHTFIQYCIILFLAFNWFNPFIWIFYMYVNRDMEIACDRGALKVLGEEQKSAYALQLIQAAENMVEQNEVVFHNNFVQYDLKERIVAIMKFKKFSVAVMAASMLLPFSVATVFGASDNYVFNDEINYQQYDFSATSENTLNIDTTVSEDTMYIPWEQLEPYVQEPVETRAASSLNIVGFRVDYISLEAVRTQLTLTTEQYGYTYTGTVKLVRLEQVGSLYAAYYNGTLYR